MEEELFSYTLDKTKRILNLFETPDSCYSTNKCHINNDFCLNSEKFTNNNYNNENNDNNNDYSKYLNNQLYFKNNNSINYNIKSIISEFYNSNNHNLNISNKMNQIDLDIISNKISNTFISLLKDREFINLENKRLKTKIEQLEANLKSYQDKLDNFSKLSSVKILSNTNTDIIDKVISLQKENAMLHEDIRRNEFKYTFSKECKCEIKYKSVIDDLNKKLSKCNSLESIFYLHLENITKFITKFFFDTDINNADALTKYIKSNKVILESFINEGNFIINNKIEKCSQLKKCLFNLEFFIKEILTSGFVYKDSLFNNNIYNSKGEEKVLKNRLNICKNKDNFNNDRDINEEYSDIKDFFYKKYNKQDFDKLNLNYGIDYKKNLDNTVDNRICTKIHIKSCDKKIKNHYNNNNNNNNNKQNNSLSKQKNDNDTISVKKELERLRIYDNSTYINNQINKKNNDNSFDIKSIENLKNKTIKLNDNYINYNNSNNFKNIDNKYNQNIQKFNSDSNNLNNLNSNKINKEINNSKVIDNEIECSNNSSNIVLNKIKEYKENLSKRNIESNYKKELNDIISSNTLKEHSEFVHYSNPYLLHKINTLNSNGELARIDNTTDSLSKVPYLDDNLITESEEKNKLNSSNFIESLTSKNNLIKIENQN